MSLLAELLLGVLHGLVLGSLLFVLEITRQHCISMHSYADDTQLYISFDHRDMSSMYKAVKSLECELMI